MRIFVTAWFERPFYDVESGGRRCVIVRGWDENRKRVEKRLRVPSSLYVRSNSPLTEGEKVALRDRWRAESFVESLQEARILMLESVAASGRAQRFDVPVSNGSGRLRSIRSDADLPPALETVKDPEGPLFNVLRRMSGPRYGWVEFDDEAIFPSPPSPSLRQKSDGDKADLCRCLFVAISFAPARSGCYFSPIESMALLVKGRDRDEITIVSRLQIETAREGEFLPAKLRDCVTYVRTERELLKNLLDLIKEQEPDRLICHSSEGCDLVAFLQQRCREMQIPSLFWQSMESIDMSRYAERFCSVRKNHGSEPSDDQKSRREKLESSALSGFHLFEEFSVLLLDLCSLAESYAHEEERLQRLASLFSCSLEGCLAIPLADLCCRALLRLDPAAAFGSFSCLTEASSSLELPDLETGIYRNLHVYDYKDILSDSLDKEDEPLLELISECPISISAFLLSSWGFLSGRRSLSLQKAQDQIRSRFRTAALVYGRDFLFSEGPLDSDGLQLREIFYLYLQTGNGSAILIDQTMDIIRVGIEAPLCNWIRSEIDRFLISTLSHVPFDINDVSSRESDPWALRILNGPHKGKIKTVSDPFYSRVENRGDLPDRQDMDYDYYDRLYTLQALQLEKLATKRKSAELHR